MKLSIIVPVYNMNHDNNLTFCLDSLINQTVRDYEIIAVDDASTDDSLSVLRDYEAKYPEKFKVITYSENKHQGGAKNEGLKVASGEWIGFIDSDDWITKDYYEKLIKKAEDTGADIVGCTYSTVGEHTYEVGDIAVNNTEDQCGELDTDLIKKHLLNPASMVIKIYKASVIKDNNLNFPEGIFYEDNCAARVWIPYFKHFEMIDEPMYYYLQHNTSTIHTVTKERCTDRVTAMDLLLKEYKDRGLYNTYKDELEWAYTMFGFRITLFSYMIGCPKKQVSFVKFLRKKLLEAFPDYEKNKYFDIPDAEEKKMVRLCMKSPTIFFIYYSLLWKYRNMRNKK